MIKFPLPGGDWVQWASRFISALGPELSELDRKIDAAEPMLPDGTIVRYNGKGTPEGWVACDGKNGTPDLRPTTYIMRKTQ